jgi:two-component system CheB/CheR fusion protein
MSTTGNNLFAAHTPLCAVGASAGGVAALQTFFANVGCDLGLAFVVVMHLSPDHPSAMSEILATRTSMPVHQVQNSEKLKPNCIYVVPPDRELVIEGDDLTARPFSDPRGHRMAIDTLFRSVAARNDKGVAVLLSGSGSDGALSLRAIKEAGGIVLVQDPNEAEYPMMPESAIETGFVDVVAPITQLAMRLAEMVRCKTVWPQVSEEEAERKLHEILVFLRRSTGHDFSAYKRATALRRIRRRMQATGQESLGGYYSYLKINKQEAHELLSDLLISVTMFFRDPKAFAALAENVVKALFDKLEGEGSIRVWVVGCAGGEEAYSIGILLLEEAANRDVHPMIQIFASDIDVDALGAAREGRYPKAIESDVSEQRLRRFFVQEQTHYRVRKELRDLVLFASHSVLKDPPFIRVDLVSCRNLMIYLRREIQCYLHGLFHYALKPNGYMFLGSAETLDVQQSLFSSVDRDARIYMALGIPEKVAPLPPHSTSEPGFLELSPMQAPRVEQTTSVGHAHAAALEKDAPPSALVDSSRRILHLSPTVGRFFRPSEGPFSLELAAQVRPELRADLSFALQRALDHDEPTLTLPIPVAVDGEHRLVAIHVTPVRNGAPTDARKALVFFLDTGKVNPADEAVNEEGADRGEVARLHHQLAAAQDRLSATRSEYERAAQDSRAANEELRSINEEYRSTAEELETSKEELQSLNEELQTLNAELSNKLDVISSAHNDLQNLIAATEIGTLFLDVDHRITFFTSRATDYFNVTTSDIGRVISDFSNRLAYNDLEQDIATVLKSLVPVDKEIRTTADRWLSMQVRPYRTLDDRIEGVVVTLNDITKLKLAEHGLAEELRAMTRLQQLSSKALQADQLEVPLEAILEAIVELLRADFGTIQLYDETSKMLRIVAHRGLKKRFLDHFATVDAASGSAYGIALAKSERVAFEDVQNEPILAQSRAESVAAGYRAVVAIPLVSNSGKTVGMLATHFCDPHKFSLHELRLVDICARQAADVMSVFLLQQALRDADRRKDEFLAMLAHELRNPLTPIRNAVEILKRGNVPIEQFQRLQSLLERQVSKLIRLVDELMDVSRITRGKMELRLQCTAINDVLHQSIETAMPLIEAKQQTLNVSFQKDPLFVDGDPMRLSQVFSNLLNNASKYTAIKGRIEISMERDGDGVIVVIRDNGAGFSSESRAHVFDLFNQGDHPSGNGQNGIGVGLALVRAIVDLHGGTIELLSEGKGKGSEFRVRLMLSKISLSIAAPQSQNRSDSNATPRRLLIVDDQQDVANSLAMLIHSLGAEAQTVFDGKSALSMITQFNPDMVVIDLGMPDMNGYELARKIRALANGPNLVLIAYSGWSQEEARQRALEAGFDKFLVKPSNIDDLQNLLVSPSGGKACSTI